LQQFDAFLAKANF
ncbi:unnamed protein product, partial [Allacma fusca]